MAGVEGGGEGGAAAITEGDLRGEAGEEGEGGVRGEGDAGEEGVGAGDERVGGAVVNVLKKTTKT